MGSLSWVVGQWDPTVPKITGHHHCSCSLLTTWQQDPTVEDTTYTSHKTWRNHVGAGLEASSHQDSFHSAGRSYAVINLIQRQMLWATGMTILARTARGSGPWIQKALQEMEPIPGTVPGIKKLWLTRQVVGPRKEPPTVIPLNGHSIKIPPTAFLQYPQISTFFNPHQRSFCLSLL